MKYFLALCVIAYSITLKSQKNQVLDHKEDYVLGELFIRTTQAYGDLTYDPSKKDTGTLISKKWIKKYGIQQIRLPFSQLKDEKLQYTYVIRFSNAALVENFIQDLKSLNYVELVEKVPNYQLFFTPNDYAGLWHLPKIQADQAWDIQQGSSNVLLAVVDDAVKMTHQDLSAKIWTNPGETPANGLDDDGNGYVDDVNGWDAADNDNNPNPPAGASDFYFSHGTHVAGIAAGATNNGVGIASIGFNVTIMPVKIGADANSGLTGAYDGVTYAIASNADIISMSWGGGAYSSVYQTIFDNAYAQGIVCVAAAGNSNSSTPMYPAAYNHVISVAASDQNDLKASFTNYGSTIDVTAPGVDIISSVATTNTSQLDYDGTSMACPMVSGIVGLMLSHVPTLTVDEVENCLEASCDDFYPLNPGYIGQLGAGRVNAFQALQCLKLIRADFSANFLQACPGQVVQFTDASSGNNPVTSWQWLFPGGTPSSSTLQNPAVTYNSPGTYTVTQMVFNADGSDTLVKTSYITIAAPTANISGTYTIFAGFTVNIPVNFTGNGPWDLTYFDGTANTTVNGITSNPYFISVAPSDTTTYTITAFNDAFCAGISTDSSVVNVIAGTSSIACYFTKMYGDLNNNTLFNYYFDPTENEFGLCGQTSGGNPLFMKLAQDGTILTQKEYSGSPDYFSTITRASNGDWLMLGQVSGQSDIYVTRVDEDGNMIWSKKYDEGSERAPFLSKSLSADEYFVTFMGDLSGSQDDLAIMKIDGTGNMVWSRQYDFTDDQFYYCTPNSLGGIVATGGLHNFSWGWASGMVNMNADGLITQSKDVRNSNGPEVRCETYYILNTLDGGYATLGMYNTINPTTNPNDLSFKKFDFNMNLEWERTIEVDYTYSVIGGARGLAQDNSGSFYVSLSQPTSSTSQYAKILKFDPSGNYVWTKSFPNVPYLRISNTNSFPEDNLILFGSYDGGSFGGQDVFFARTDTSLNSCLAQSDVSTLYTSPFDVLALNMSQANLPYTPTNNISAATPLNYLDTNLCDPCFVCNLAADFTHSFACMGDSVYFYDQSSDPNANITYYEWNFGDGVVLIGPSNPSHIYSSAGVYTVTLVVANDATPICYDTIQKTITVYDSLVAIVSPTDTLVCPNQPVNLWAEGHCGAEPYTYFWGPSAGLSDPNIQNPVAINLNNTTYFVTVYDAAGDSAVQVVNISIDPGCCQPSAGVSGPTEGCTFNEIFFVNQSVTQSSNPTYIWYFGLDAMPTSYIGTPAPGVTFSTAGNHTIWLTVSDSCGTDSASFTFYLGDAPLVNAGNDTLLCSNDTIALGKNTVGAGLIYSWTPIINLFELNQPNPIAYINGSISYVVEATDNFTGCKNTDTVHIYRVNPGVELIDDSLICANDTMILSAEFPLAVDYHWNTGSTDSAIWVLDSGLYSVTVTYGNCVFSDQANIVYKSVSGLNLGPDTNLCEGDTLILSALINGATQYQWSTGSTETSIIITEGGNYQVVVYNGCEALARNKDIAMVECECTFIIPNVFSPNDDGHNSVFKAQMEHVNSCDFQLLSIFNRWGKKVYESKDNEWKGVNMNGESVSEGTYYYVFKIGKKQYSGFVTLIR